MDDETKNLSQRTLRGGAITLSAQLVKLLINLGVLAVLARVLTPGDFGLVAMATVFLGFSAHIKDFGLSTATLQSQTITHQQVSALFCLNVMLSAILACVFALLAPVLAAFYETPALERIVPTLSLGILASGLGAQHIALLRRRMDFLVVSIAEVGGLLTGGIIGIALALNGMGVWALVTMQVTQPFVVATIAFLFCPWLPGWPKMDAGSFKMLRFGGNLTLFNLVNYVTRNADDALVGRYVGDNALGAYSRAYGLLMLPLRQLSRPIAAVTIPALSRLQDDATSFRSYFLKSVEVIALATMPTVVVMLILADEIILLVMGPQWSTVALLFKLFALLAFFQSIPIASSWTMIALGRADRMLKWGVLQMLIAVPVFALGLVWGTAGVAAAASVMGLIMMGPALAYALHGSPVTFADVLNAIRVPLLFSISLMAVLWVFEYLLQDLFFVYRIVAVSGIALMQFAITCIIVPRLRQDLVQFLAIMARKPETKG
ncbi:lipopolysaccharide biosynthesis protein [Ruegeria sp. AU67]|uniref:lipopolysaccharide biosynthesis protein n=1 Tax=Ruegeria sp. AU67 TaxID=2108530 RepID=UPI00135A3EDF|nr:lipopolysaccharide biosynthesis protein [Ruegeria sp. AU67]